MSMTRLETTAGTLSALNPTRDGEQPGMLIASLAPAPRRVELNRSRVRWSFPEPWRFAARRKPSEKILGQFLNLRDARDPEVKEFVKQWGPLWLCEKHNAPTGHPGYTLDPYADLPHREKIDNQWYCSEPTDGYRLWSWRAFEISRLVLHARGELNLEPNEWPSLPTKDGTIARPHSNKPWQTLAIHLNNWLRLGALRPVVLPEPKGGVRLDLGTDGIIGFNPLFAVIGLHLATLATGTRGAAICVECNKIYLSDRKLALDRANYCPSCGIRAAWRRNSAKYRQRKTSKKRNQRGA